MIADWDDAYNNRAHIEGAEAFPVKWAALAQDFRKMMSRKGLAKLDLAYGGEERERLDFFYPEGAPRGLAVFAHGGYWKMFDKSVWSHLAAGPLALGWAVCIPSYTLAPQARISHITRQFARAVEFAAERIDGPIRLAGHSAGGHLVSRMICESSPLAANTARRIEHVASISGVHDLRPLMRTSMNETFRLDEDEAVAESPALQSPINIGSVLCWVGVDERPEFLRQNDLLTLIWSGLGVSIRSVHMSGRHHFTVIEDLADPDSCLTEAFAG